jgi:hypothetical protein
MTHGIVDPHTPIDFVFGRDVATTQDNGCGLLEPCTEVLYGTVLVNL